MNEDLYILLRVLVAALLAGFLGWEREASGKSAGLRTHILIGISSVLFVMIADILIVRYSPYETMRFDPVRVIEAVVTGISFIGAGIIVFKRGEQTIHGLTTAAGILTTAAIGALVGLDRFFLAVGSTAIVFFVLRFVNMYEMRFLAPADEGKAETEIGKD